ncbi:MAG: hypothetical protein AB1633_03515 [Elusimicrobiota bacterium]
MNRLRKLFNRWKVVLEKIGNFQARLILTIIYFTVVLPYGIIIRIFFDPLRIKKMTGSNWLPKKLQKIDLESLRKQF